MITVIIPAHQEETHIGRTLALIARGHCPAPGPGGPPQLVVAANGCRDATAARAREMAGRLERAGWRFDLLDLPQGGKTGAINAAEAIACHPIRAYVDADIHVSPGLLAALARVLDRPEPAYAGGRLRIRRAQSWVSRRYARFWQRLPFMAEGVPGCGVYAVNAAGRARWGAFPAITADDIFVRRHFAPGERHGVADGYSWPITEGFADLVRVRRRQNRGLAELAAACPDLADERGETGPGARRALGLALRDPVGFTIYALVALVVKTPLFPPRSAWDRGRDRGR